MWFINNIKELERKKAKGKKQRPVNCEEQTCFNSYKHITYLYILDMLDYLSQSLILIDTISDWDYWSFLLPQPIGFFPTSIPMQFFTLSISYHYYQYHTYFTTVIFSMQYICPSLFCSVFCFTDKTFFNYLNLF